MADRQFNGYSDKEFSTGFLLRAWFGAVFRLSCIESLLAAVFTRCQVDFDLNSAARVMERMGVEGSSFVHVGDMISVSTPFTAGLSGGGAALRATVIDVVAIVVVMSPLSVVCSLPLCPVIYPVPAAVAVLLC